MRHKERQLSPHWHFENVLHVLGVILSYNIFRSRPVQVKGSLQSGAHALWSEGGLNSVMLSMRRNSKQLFVGEIKLLKSADMIKVFQWGYYVWQMFHVRILSEN